MELAIQEMLQTPKEPFDKEDPLVGAVLVNKNGSIIAKAHRGIYGQGDHAEFSIFEKVNPKRDLSDCTIYVTLEPCTKRSDSKTPCAQRVVDSGISRIVIGMLDPNPEIYQQGINLLKKNKIKVDYFDYDLAEEIRLHNDEFSNSFASAKKGKKKMRQKEKLDTANPAEKQPIWEATIKDLSKPAIASFLKSIKSSYKIPSKELWEYFHKSGYIVFRNKKIVPTLAGLVIFGEKPNTFPALKEHLICAEKYVYNAERKPTLNSVGSQGRKLIVGPLNVMVQEAIGFFIKHTAKVPRIEGIKRINHSLEYPKEFIREAIVNALVHRDYSRQSHIYYNIYPDRIEITSPGNLTLPNTIERVNEFDVTPVRRNCVIADAAHSMLLMDRRGGGIPSMPGQLRDYGLRPPLFDEKHGCFTITVFGREKSSPILRLTEEIKKHMNERQEKIIEDIWKNGRTTSEECSVKYKISRETANQDFRKLMELGIIKKRGSARSTYYVLGPI